MKWSRPYYKPGTQRTRTKFAWLPTRMSRTIDDNDKTTFVWFERYRVGETLHLDGWYESHAEPLDRGASL